MPQVQTAANATNAAATIEVDGYSFTLPEAVDALTAIQVQIAAFEAIEKQLKAGLIETGLSEVCGSKTRVVVSTSKAGTTVAWKAVAEALNPSPALIAANSTVKDPVTSVRVYGYN